MGVVESAIACWVSRRPPCRLGGGPACALRTTKNPRVAENRGPPAQCQAGGTDTVPDTTGVQSPGYRRCAARLRSPTVGPCVPRIRPTHDKRSQEALSSAASRRATGAVPQRRATRGRGPSAVAAVGRHQITTRDPATPGARRHPSRDNRPCGPTATRRGVCEPPRRRSPSVLWPPLRGGLWDVRMGDLLRRHPVRRCLQMR